MLIQLNHIAVLAVLYLSILSSAVPVLQTSVEVATSTGIVESVNDGREVALEARARGRTSRTKSKPRPKPKPVKTIRKPVPKKTPIRKPVPTKTSIKHVPPTKRPTPTPPAHRPTVVSKPPTKPGKPPVRTTAKPVPRPTKAPGKVTSKPTKTTSRMPTATPTAPQCPVKKPTKGKKGPRALFEWAVGIFKRDRAEFIGWHGTNSDTAKLWTKKGYLAHPKSSGWPWSSGGGSGANHELGDDGLYVSDAMVTSQGFASKNALEHKGTTPALCALFARSSTRWRAGINKVWLPDSIIRDDEDPAKSALYEKQRIEWIQRVIPHSSGKDVVRFAPFDKGRGGPPNQFFLPSSLTKEVYAVCVDSPEGGVPPGANVHIDFNTERHPWNVRDTPCA